jgi:hypothetical protein
VRETHLPLAEGQGKDPAAKAVCRPVKKGALTPLGAAGPFAPDNSPLQIFNFPGNDC